MGGGALAATPAAAEHYNSRFNFYTLLVILTGAANGLLLGYDNGFSGGVQAMESFQYKFFRGSTWEANFGSSKAQTTPYCKYADDVYQLTLALPYLTGAFAAIAYEIIARKFGRKPCMIGAGFCYTAGGVILAVSPNLGCLLAGRAILGIGLGGGCMTGPLYLTEMAPAKLRGTLSTLYQLLVTSGILIAGLINFGAQYIEPWGWRLPCALAAVPGLFVLIAGIVLPESPNSLAEHGHYEKAHQVLKKIRGVDDVSVELKDLVYAARQSNLIKNPYWNLISKKKYRPQLVIAALTQVFQQFTGINAIVFYSPILFASLASGALGGILNTVIIFGVFVLATLPALYLLDKFGRRKILFASAIWMLITQIAVAIVLAVEFKKYGQDLPKGSSIGILILICLYIIGFAWGWGPIAWIYPVEIQPLETRAAGSGINTFSNLLFSFIIGQFFTSMLCKMEYGVFLFFAGFLVLMTLFVYFLFPETKGIPIESVHAAFKTHPIWSTIYPEVAEVQNVDAGPETEVPEDVIKMAGQKPV